MKYLLLALALLLPTVASALQPGAGNLQPLEAAQVGALLQPPAQGERLIALWALDCAYCEANLQALAKLQQAHPQDIELITVATDDIGQAAAIAQRLHAAGMDDYPARAYADPTPERINYLLDPNWGGETPRVLVIRADGTRQGYSGALNSRILRKLMP